jgi:hypothetical protein
MCEETEDFDRRTTIVELHCIFDRTQGNQKIAAVGPTEKCVWRLVSLPSWRIQWGPRSWWSRTPLFRRPSRVVKPTGKVRDTARQLEDTAIETRRNTRHTTRNVPAEEQIDRPTDTRKSSDSGSGSDGRAMLQKALDLLAESRRETKRLQEALKEQMEMTKELQEAAAKQEQTVHGMGKQMVEMKEQMTEDQPFRCAQTAVSRASPHTPTRAYLLSMALTPCREPRQFRRERRIQWCVQREVAAADEGERNPRGPLALHRCLLFRANCNHCNQWPKFRKPTSTTSRSSAGVAPVADTVSILQRRPSTDSD